MRGELFGVVAVSDISTISGQNNSACDPYGQAAGGNMTKVPKWQADLTNHISCTYDAWNRLVKVQDDADPAVTVAEYRYDGLNHRIVKLVASGANWDRTDSYCNDNWQCLEERKAAGVSTENRDSLATTVYTQYLWDIRYIDAVVMRWADLNLDGDFGDSDEVLYYAQDANFNTTMVVRPDGSRAERYFYDPYGKVTFVYPDGTINSFTTSLVKNEILYSGYRFDFETGLYHVRNRMYQPTLAAGRWLQRDPLQYIDGMSLYQYCMSKPVGVSDPYGLEGPATQPTSQSTRDWWTCCPGVFSALTKYAKAINEGLNASNSVVVAATSVYRDIAAYSQAWNRINSLNAGTSLTQEVLKIVGWNTIIAGTVTPAIDALGVDNVVVVINRLPNGRYGNVPASLKATAIANKAAVQALQRAAFPLAVISIGSGGMLRAVDIKLAADMAYQLGELETTVRNYQKRVQSDYKAQLIKGVQLATLGSVLEPMKWHEEDRDRCKELEKQLLMEFDLYMEFQKSKKEEYKITMKELADFPRLLKELDKVTPRGSK